MGCMRQFLQERPRLGLQGAAGLITREKIYSARKNSAHTLRGAPPVLGFNSYNSVLTKAAAGQVKAVPAQRATCTETTWITTGRFFSIGSQKKAELQFAMKQLHQCWGHRIQRWHRKHCSCHTLAVSIQPSLKSYLKLPCKLSMLLSPAQAFLYNQICFASPSSSHEGRKKTEQLKQKGKCFIIQWPSFLLLKRNWVSWYPCTTLGFARLLCKLFFLLCKFFNPRTAIATVFQFPKGTKIHSPKNQNFCPSCRKFHPSFKDTEFYSNQT